MMKLKTSALILAMLSAGALTAAASTITGTVNAPGAKTKEGSVVYIAAIPGKTFPAPAKQFKMDQQWLEFKPHVLAVPVGATVEFANNDTVTHNVNWPSIGGDKALKKNLGKAKPGQSLTYKFTHAGVVPILCDMHPDMSAFIVVTPTPYAAVTNRGGKYTIKDVPPGHYRLIAWHEGHKTAEKTITVGAGAATADFALAK